MHGPQQSAKNAIEAIQEVLTHTICNTKICDDTWYHITDDTTVLL